MVTFYSGVGFVKATSSFLQYFVGSSTYWIIARDSFVHCDTHKNFWTKVECLYSSHFEPVEQYSEVTYIRWRSCASTHMRQLCRFQNWSMFMFLIFLSPVRSYGSFLFLSSVLLGLIVDVNHSHKYRCVKNWSYRLLCILSSMPTNQWVEMIERKTYKKIRNRNIDLKTIIQFFTSNISNGETDTLSKMNNEGIIYFGRE